MSTHTLLISQHRRKRPVLKTLSLVLVITFLFQDLSLADPKILKGQLFPPKLPRLDIPESIATVEDSWRANTPLDAPANKHGGLTQGELNKSCGMIYLIQDAHTNESAQKNIAKTIDLVLEQQTNKGVDKPNSTGDAKAGSFDKLRTSCPIRPERTQVTRARMGLPKRQDPRILTLHF